MRHLISILLANEVGALTRVAGLFSTRGYNIESLTVAPTSDATVSRLTLVTRGSTHVISQISDQLLKLVDVVDIVDLTRMPHIEREMLLLKIQVYEESRAQFDALVKSSGASTVEDTAECYTLEYTATGPEITALVEMLKEHGKVLTTVRSGGVAVTLGKPAFRNYKLGED